ncbi:uncharacterized protein LOC113549759 [Rhopalosiphum maidis]|uniref:uncharacterized protein LOC113549759 n=1 Tax=Rhopalosiphum maidis TaxID=43146 RepID=UPI000EFF1ECA|nr:uncharacterized protein LOC113549759 [Rhopalosiphum maidis]
MNRLIFFAAALSLVFTVANTQSVSDSDVDSDIIEESTTENPTEYIEDLTKIDLTNNDSESVKSREDEMANELAYMITFITKSFADMSKITEDMKGLSNKTNIDEASMKNLVNNLINYVEDTEIMKQQINSVVEYRDQFQDTILKNLNSLPVSTEEAKQMENELRKQMKIRLPNIPTSQNIMDLPASMPNIFQN